MGGAEAEGPREAVVEGVQLGGLVGVHHDAVALGAGAVGYSIYADYRDNKNKPAPVETKPVTTEETTK